MRLLPFLIFLLYLLPSASAVVYHDYYGPYGGDDFITWEEDYLENNKSHATPPFAPQATFGGCYISTGKGLVDDLDCDKVPDPEDNCLGAPNPDQVDQNGNGLGDACDLVVDALLLDPPEVLEGRALVVTVLATNYQPFPLRNVRLRIEIPSLGLQEVADDDFIEAGDQERYEFYFRVPECAPTGSQDVVLFVEYSLAPGLTESFHIPARVRVTSSGICDLDRPPGKSIVTILDIQDVDPSLGGVYPFTIVNDETESQSYVLTVEGTESWGDYLIKPRSLIIVPPGSAVEGELWVYAQQDVSGQHSFVLSVRSKDDAQQVLLTARIKQGERTVEEDGFFQFGIFAVGIIILLLAASFLVRKRRRK